MACRPTCPLRHTPTCSAMPVASPSPTKGQTRGSFKTTWDTGIFSTPSGTRRPIRRGLNGCGGERRTDDLGTFLCTGHRLTVVCNAWNLLCLQAGDGYAVPWETWYYTARLLSYLQAPAKGIVASGGACILQQETNVRLQW